MTKTVALQKCEEYDFNQVYQALKQLVELVPPPDVKDKVVLLKPNILYPKKPEMAVCTHPIVVGAAVKVFCELGAKRVIVGESPAIAGSTSAAKATGMYDIVVKNGGEWADFHKAVSIPAAQSCKSVMQFDFAAQFEEADVLVSIAKLKTHQLMQYTGAMKNLFGLMIGLDKAQCHYRFPKKEDFAAFLTDLVVTAQPDYAIMDAIVGMEGPGGPGSGDPKKIGFLAASDNILALDWKCASLVGYNPYNILNLEQALRRQIWLTTPNEIETVGTAERLCRCSSFKIVKNPAETLGLMVPKILDVLAKKVFVKYPKINSNKCQQCRRCEEICPAHIIKMNGKGGVANLIDKKQCLHCFCCHEICPAGAIKLKRF